jgi:hypothetical protein
MTAIPSRRRGGIRHLSRTALSTEEAGTMAVNLERHDVYDSIQANPVARAHARAGARGSESEQRPLGRVLLWVVVIPAIVFLVSNPVGWVVLFLLVLGSAAATGFGGIL